MNLSIKSSIVIMCLTLCSTVFAADYSNSESSDSTKTTSANTNGNDNSKQWTCETNASSATTDTDKAADKDMGNAKPGKSAFDYAFKNCRDCTKITCKSE
jgi:hypothetical protein